MKSAFVTLAIISVSVVVSGCTQEESDPSLHLTIRLTNWTSESLIAESEGFRAVELCPGKPTTVVDFEICCSCEDIGSMCVRVIRATDGQVVLQTDNARWKKQTLSDCRHVWSLDISERELSEIAPEDICGSEPLTSNVVQCQVQ